MSFLFFLLVQVDVVPRFWCPNTCCGVGVLLGVLGGVLLFILLGRRR